MVEWSRNFYLDTGSPLLISNGLMGINLQVIASQPPFPSKCTAVVLLASHLLPRCLSPGTPPALHSWSRLVKPAHVRRVSTAREFCLDFSHPMHFRFTGRSDRQQNNNADSYITGV